MFKQSRALWITAILALLAIVCGVGEISGVLKVPIAAPNAMDARDWINLWTAISWILVVAGGLVAFGICFVWLTRALDKAERALLDNDSKRKP